MKNKYYICSNCGGLTTEIDILESIECGVQGDLCDCEYMTYFYDYDTKDFDVYYPRIYFGYTRVEKKLWDLLFGIKNDVIRLKTWERLKDDIKN